MVSQEADSLTMKTMKRKQCINKKIWSSRVRGLDTVSKCLCAIHWTSKDYNRAAFIHLLVWERTKQYRVDHVRHSVSPGSSEATESVGKKTWIFGETKTPIDNGKLTWLLSFVFYALVIKTQMRKRLKIRFYKSSPRNKGYWKYLAFCGSGIIVIQTFAAPRNLFAHGDWKNSKDSQQSILRVSPRQIDIIAPW